MSMSRKIRNLMKTLCSALLFVFQYIPGAGPWMGPMIFPLVLYVWGLIWAHPDFLEAQITLLFFSERLMFGRIVALMGLAIFLVAFRQFLRKKVKIITTGLHSLVRHPQYFGIIVMTLGFSIMCIQYRPSANFEVLPIWLIQVFGYILLAAYEEHYLLMEHKKEYQQYRDKVPFIFPCPRITIIPDPIVSVILASIIAFLLTFL